MSDDGLAALEARYQKEGPEVLTTVLLAGAAAVLAAAIIAVPFLAETSGETTRLFLLTAGLLTTLVGALLWLTLDWKDPAEALSVTVAALLIPASLMFLFAEPGEFLATPWFAWIVAFMGFSLLLVPSRTVLAPTAGAAMMEVCALVALAEANDDLASTAWLVVGAAMVGVAFAVQRLPAWRERHAILTLAAPIVLAFATVTFWFEVIDALGRFTGGAELAVALVQAPIIAGAFHRRCKPLLASSVLVVAVDAIVFGFDIGDLALGIPMLLVVSGALVALALWDRRQGAA